MQVVADQIVVANKSCGPAARRQEWEGTHLAAWLHNQPATQEKNVESQSYKICNSPLWWISFRIERTMKRRRGGEGGVNSALAEEAKSFKSGATFSLQ